MHLTSSRMFPIFCFAHLGFRAIAHRPSRLHYDFVFFGVRTFLACLPLGILPTLWLAAICVRGGGEEGGRYPWGPSKFNFLKKRAQWKENKKIGHKLLIKLEKMLKNLFIFTLL